MSCLAVYGHSVRAFTSPAPARPPARWRGLWQQPSRANPAQKLYSRMPPGPHCPFTPITPTWQAPVSCFLGLRSVCVGSVVSSASSARQNHRKGQTARARARARRGMSARNNNNNNNKRSPEHANQRKPTNHTCTRARSHTGARVRVCTHRTQTRCPTSRSTCAQCPAIRPSACRPARRNRTGVTRG